MTSTPPLDALELDAARELVGRLLDELGASPALALTLQAPSLAHLLEVVLPARHTWRLVELDHAGLPSLLLPALTTRRGQLAIVRRVRGWPRQRKVLVELPSGPSLALDPAELLRDCAATALELAPCLDREGRFTQRLARFVAGRGRELGTLLGLALILSTLGLIAPAATRVAIDDALPERSPKLLSLVALAMLLVATQRALFSWLEQRATLALHARLELAVSSPLFDHLLRIPFAALAREHVGSWLETLSGGRQVHGLLTESLVRSFLQLITALVYEPRWCLRRPTSAWRCWSRGSSRLPLRWRLPWAPAASNDNRSRPRRSSRERCTRSSAVSSRCAPREQRNAASCAGSRACSMHARPPCA
jgi:ABC-type bacteriocin/lantibiotic exporter with double-glycine peptidase domain